MLGLKKINVSKHLGFLLYRYPDVDLFFPDGTWCHNDGKDDFFCQQHQCKTSSPRGGRAVGIPQINYMVCSTKSIFY